MEFALLDARRRPSFFCHPFSVPMVVMRLRRDRIFHPDPERGFVHDAVVDILQPAIPPSQTFLQEADGRSGLREMRIFVRPRPDQALAGRFQVGKQSEHRVGVAVRPAADGIHRALDIVVVFANGTVFVEFVPVLAFKPLFQPKPASLKAALPDVLPIGAEEFGIGRRRVERKHVGGPSDVVAKHGAAHVMDVVGVPVVGRADRNHCLERFGPPGRNL